MRYACKHFTSCWYMGVDINKQKWVDWNATILGIINVEK